MEEDKLMKLIEDLIVKEFGDKPEFITEVSSGLFKVNVGDMVAYTGTKGVEEINKILNNYAKV